MIAPDRSDGRDVYDETDREIVRAGDRARALRRRGPEPACLPDLGRPRGGAARADARRRAALAQSGSGARRRSRTSRTWPRSSASSSTCCWCATCAGSPAEQPCRAEDEANTRDRRAATSASLVRSSPIPTTSPLVAAREAGRGRRGTQGGQAHPVDQGSRRPSAGGACGPTSAASTRARRALRLGAGTRAARPSSAILRTRELEIRLDHRRGHRGRAEQPPERCRGCRASARR